MKTRKKLIFTLQAKMTIMKTRN